MAAFCTRRVTTQFLVLEIGRLDLGFTSIAPYYHNPIAGAHYLKADL